MAGREGVRKDIYLPTDLLDRIEADRLTRTVELGVGSPHMRRRKTAPMPLTTWVVLACEAYLERCTKHPTGAHDHDHYERR